LYADRFSKGEQLLRRPFLSETKKEYEGGGRLKVKIYIFLTEITHEPLYLNNAVWFSKRLWTHMKVSFDLLFCLQKSLNIVMVRDFEVVSAQTLKHCV
jgi:hypothetical protein